jgi:glutaredoxin
MMKMKSKQRLPGAFRAALLALGIAAFASPMAQQLYRWVDKDGRVHYTQQAPAREAAKNVEKKKLGGSPVDSERIPFSLQQAMNNFPVVLYTSPGCKAGCDDARALLVKRGIPHKEVGVSDAATTDALKAATGDNKVPAVTIGRVVQKGYEPEALNQALDAALYPRSSVFTGGLPGVPQAAARSGADTQPRGARPDADPAEPKK